MATPGQCVRWWAAAKGETADRPPSRCQRCWPPRAAPPVPVSASQRTTGLWCKAGSVEEWKQKARARRWKDAINRENKSKWFLLCFLLPFGRRRRLCNNNGVPVVLDLSREEEWFATIQEEELKNTYFSFSFANDKDNSLPQTECDNDRNHED